jgi:hypothetical protein
MATYLNIPQLSNYSQIVNESTTPPTTLGTTINMGKPVGLGNSPQINSYLDDKKNLPSLLKRSDKGPISLKQINAQDIIISDIDARLLDLEGIY